MLNPFPSGRVTAPDVEPHPGSATSADADASRRWCSCRCLAAWRRDGRPMSSCRRLFPRNAGTQVGFVSGGAITVIAKTALKRTPHLRLRTAGLRLCCRWRTIVSATRAATGYPKWCADCSVDRRLRDLNLFGLSGAGRECQSARPRIWPNTHCAPL
jgi:hypothetical protein